MKLEVDPVRLRNVCGCDWIFLFKQRLQRPESMSLRSSGWSPVPTRSRSICFGGLLRRITETGTSSYLRTNRVDQHYPRDFRTFEKGAVLTTPTLEAFDDAGFLIEKIVDLPRPHSHSARVCLPSWA